MIASGDSNLFVIYGTSDKALAHKIFKNKSTFLFLTTIKHWNLVCSNFDDN